MKVDFHIVAEDVGNVIGEVRIVSLEGPLTDLVLAEKILMAALMAVRNGPRNAKQVTHRITEGSPKNFLLPLV
jgi:hypothetical protein